MLVIILVSIASLIAAGNIYGVASAMRRQRRGDDRGFSAIPLFSLSFSVAAWIVGPEPVGLWLFLPTSLDPGTWSILLLPWFAFTDKT